MALILTDRSLDHVQFSIEPLIQSRIDEKKAMRHAASKPICRFFTKNQCDKGHSCPFRHTRTDKVVVCKHWLRGLCKKNEQCEFLHIYDMRLMPQCQFFATDGKCSNGDDCDFLHLKPEEHVRDCPWYKRGFCKHGPKCRNRHVRNEPCFDYLAGFCINGPKCKFGHPKFERPASDNVTFIAPPICTRCGNVGHRASNCQINPRNIR